MSPATGGGRSSLDLRGKRVLITGGASGIGAATCRIFAAHGARIVAVGLHGGGLEETVGGLSDAVAVTADVSRPDEVDDAFAAAVDAVGGLDMVVHAAGIDDPAVKQRVHDQISAGQPIDVLADITDEQWRVMVSVNLGGAFYVLRSALRCFRDARAGSVVLIGSETGVRGLPGLGHYAATKGGVHALVRSAAKEAISYGVRVNGIAPGVVDTPMSRRSGGVFGSAADAVAPIGRAGRPEEIASVALFLCSELASYVVGEIINVDGGRIAS